MSPQEARRPVVQRSGEPDIVERLAAEARELDFDPVGELLLEAAAECERLRAAISLVRCALAYSDKEWGRHLIERAVRELDRGEGA